MIRRLPWSGIAVAALLACVVLASCSSGGESQPAGQQTPAAASPAGEQGPGDTVQRFYNFLNERRFADAQALYTQEALKIVDDPSIMGAGAFEQWAQNETKQGTLSSVSILHTEQQGADAASVDFEVKYRDGSAERRQVGLKREGGIWKMGLMG